MTPTVEFDSWLIQWAQEARDLHDVAESLIRTSFVPQSFKKDSKGNWRDKDVVVSETVAAILAGKEVGLQPMAALRSIQIIQNTPAMTALAQRGLVQSSGHEVNVTEQTDTRAVVEGRRRGSERVQRSVWTIDRAKRMNLTEKAQWKTQPSAMLVARATSECCRLTASDVLLGMPYSIEELQDQAEMPETVSKPRTAKRRTEPVEVIPPELGEPKDTPTEPESPPVEDEPWPDVPVIPDQESGDE